MTARLIVQPVPAGVDIRRCPECDCSNPPDSKLSEDGERYIMTFCSADYCHDCGHDLTEADLDPEFTIGRVVTAVL